MAETEKQKKKRLKAERLEAKRLKAENGVVDLEEDEATGEGEVYTYVGAGDNPPRRINFMGKQTFIRGKATEVTNSEVLAKIQNHPCFVEGEVEEEELIDQDEEAEAAAEKQRKIDAETNAKFQKKHMTE